MLTKWLCWTLKIAHMRPKFEAMQEQDARVERKVNATKTKEIEDSVPRKHWQHELCRRDLRVGNRLHIPWQPYHWQQLAALRKMLRPSVGRRKPLSLFKTTMGIWVHPSVDEDKNPQFQREVGSALWIQYLETYKDDHSPTANPRHKLLYILRVWWPRMISNGELWQRTKKKNIEFTIRRWRWRLRWIGHTLRNPEWNSQGAKRKGRPKTLLRRTIQQEHEDMGMSWNQLKRVAQNQAR